ncbi:MAG: hypothetical protein INH13_25720 [Cupriavidus sp.]|nr:hypothetical protein [Cupriavidus sp.]
MPRKPAEESALAADEQDFSPCREQGAGAKAEGLPREACPYSADGPHREAWLAGFDEG